MKCVSATSSFSVPEETSSFPETVRKIFFFFLFSLFFKKKTLCLLFVRSRRRHQSHCRRFVSILSLVLFFLVWRFLEFFLFFLKKKKKQTNKQTKPNKTTCLFALSHFFVSSLFQTRKEEQAGWCSLLCGGRSVVHSASNTRTFLCADDHIQRFSGVCEFSAASHQRRHQRLLRTQLRRGHSQEFRAHLRIVGRNARFRIRSGNLLRAAQGLHLQSAHSHRRHPRQRTAQ